MTRRLPMSQAAESSSIIQLPTTKKRPATPAERARAYRARKRQQKQNGVPSPVRPVPPKPVRPGPAPDPTRSRGHLPSNLTFEGRRFGLASAALAVSAFALAGVGITINGWFARSLGSTDVAGWLFLAIGVAADLAALALPTLAARRWRVRQRSAAVAGWTVWTVTFLFAVTAGIGFASVNITDVTAARSVTPATVTARVALDDAKAARDRECKTGVGAVCRQRENAVVDRQRQLDDAQRSAQGTADPQVEAAISLVAWASLGKLRPARHEFEMLRLLLLALLPQIGGVLLMIRSR